MAQIKNSTRKSEGICEKIHNAVSPFRARNRRVSGQESGRVLLQSSLSKMVPVELNHLSAQNTKKLVSLSSAAVQSAGKENSSLNKVQEFDDREILIVRGQKFSVYGSRKQDAAAQEKHENHAQFVKAKPSFKDDESVHEGRFSDYISKVKNRMMKTTSNVGDGE